MDVSDIPKGPGTDWYRLKEIWRGIRKRCENPRCKDYKAYHGKGITLCKEWHDFEVFYEWAITHGYRSDLTLDRVANNKGYNPGNCRWVSRKAQANNRTTAVRYTIDGKTRTLSQWCREYGIEPYNVLHRLEDGWTIKEAVMTPKKGKRH